MLTVGVIGGGFFGRLQIEAWSAMPDVAVAGVAEADPERRVALARDLRGVAVFPDTESLIRVMEPEVIDIAVRPEDQIGVLQKVLDGPKAVICQQPFTPSLESARAMVDLADDLATPLLVHENFRFQPWYREALRLIRAGAVGTPLQARFAMRPGDGVGPGAYRDAQPYLREMDRFLIRQAGIHFIDLFRMLLGEPVAVYADLRQQNRAIRGEDGGYFVFDFAGGGRAMFDGNRLLDHAAEDPRRTMGEFEIEGSEATLRLDGAGHLWLRRRGSQVLRRQKFLADPRAFGGGGVRAFQEHVRNWLRGGPQPETLAGDFLRNLEIEDLVYQASAKGRKLPVPPLQGAAVAADADERESAVSRLARVVSRRLPRSA